VVVVSIPRAVLHGPAAGAVAAVLSLLPSCAAPSRARSPDPIAVPVLTVESVLAPPGGSADAELEELRGSHAPAARLRTAFLLLERNRPQAAIDACAEVLYGPEPPSASAEALARYLRAEAFARLGEPERGRYDRERALQLALDPRLRARLQTGPLTAAAAAPARLLSMVPRADWRPETPIPARLETMGRIYRLTVHHSALPFRDNSPSACAAQLRVIQRNHMQHPDRRYGDIGYHFLIDPAGRIWEGRQLQWQGAHARADNNRGNIGVCLLGNFVRGGDGQRPTEAQVRTLRQLVASLVERYGIAHDQVLNHSDLVQTECPGPLLEPVVAGIAQELRAAAAARERIAATW
jgi:hypothetical protein